MSYLGELRDNRRPLIAASLGVGTSLPLFSYVNGVFSPFLISEFGWTRAQYALVGLTMLATIVVLPFIGRFTDRLGVRRIALIGTVMLPLCFLAYSQMNGSLVVFLLIFLFVLIFGTMTSGMVYTRLIAENFKRAQGFALTIVNCAPAVLAMAIVPLLNISIEKIGWRMSFIAFGLFICVSGIAAILVSPASRRNAPRETTPVLPPPSSAREDFSKILRHKTTWILLAGFFLCLLQMPLHATQMNLMLLDNGLTPQTAANIVSVYAMGTIVGRLLCGLALDRFDTPIVTAVSMGIPAIGYILLATNLDTLPVIVFSMFLVGLSVGAESDLFSFLAARYFKLEIFNTALSVLMGSAYLASATGALLASAALQLTDSFTPLLYIVTVSITVGSLLFMLLPSGRTIEKIG